MKPLRVCVVLYGTLYPLPRYGRPYNYALALKQSGLDVVAYSVSQDGQSGITEFGQVFGIGESRAAPLVLLSHLIRCRADVYYIFNHTPLLFIALMLRMLGRHVVYDIGDDYPSLISTRIAKLYPQLKSLTIVLEKALRELEGNVIRRLDCVVTLTESLRQDRVRYSKRIYAIYQTPPPAFLTAVKRVKKEFAMVYQGEISTPKGLRTILHTLRQLTSRKPWVRVLFVGDFSHRFTSKDDRQFFEDFVRKHKLGHHVEVTGWVPYEEIPLYLSKCMVGLSLIDPWCYSFKISMPDKVLDMMSCGLPIVASKELVEVKSLLAKSQAGIAVDYTRLEEVCSAIELLLDNAELRTRFGNNARQYVRNNLNWATLRDELHDVVEQVTES